MILRGIAGSVVPELHPPRAQAPPDPRAAAAGAGAAAAARFPRASCHAAPPPRHRTAQRRAPAADMPPQDGPRSGSSHAAPPPQCRTAAQNRGRRPRRLHDDRQACPHAMAHCMRYTRQASAVRPSQDSKAADQSSCVGMAVQRPKSANLAMLQWPKSANLAML